RSSEGAAGQRQGAPLRSGGRGRRAGRQAKPPAPPGGNPWGCGVGGAGGFACLPDTQPSSSASSEPENLLGVDATRADIVFERPGHDSIVMIRELYHQQRRQIQLLQNRCCLVVVEIAIFERLERSRFLLVAQV